MAELAQETPQQEYALVRRVQMGDDAAFDRLVELCAPRVYTLAFRMMGNSEDAQDVAQEAFVRMYQALPRFRQEAAFTTWLYRIVVNACHDELARRKRRPLPAAEFRNDDDSPSPLDLQATNDSPEDAYLRRERQAALQQALQELPDAFRTVVLLYDVQGFSYQEISEVLHTGMGTVKSRLNRARNLLREKISAQREHLGSEVRQSL